MTMKAKDLVKERLDKGFTGQMITLGEANNMVDACENKVRNEISILRNEHRQNVDNILTRMNYIEANLQSGGNY